MKTVVSLCTTIGFRSAEAYILSDHERGMEYIRKVLEVAYN